MIKRPGIIYLATNKVNGKIYVGKTARELVVRIREHEYDARNKMNTAFSRAIAKYGIEAFMFEVLETCAVGRIDERERHWIGIHQSRKPRGYNLTDGGDGSSGLSRPDIAEINRKKVGALNPQFGKKHTEMENARNSQALTGDKNPRFGLTLSDEFRKVISEATRRAMYRPEVRQKYLRAVKERTARIRRQRALRRIESAHRMRNRRTFMLFWNSLADERVRDVYWAKELSA